MTPKIAPHATSGRHPTRSTMSYAYRECHRAECNPMKVDIESDRGIVRVYAHRSFSDGRAVKGDLISSACRALRQPDTIVVGVGVNAGAELVHRLYVRRLADGAGGALVGLNWRRRAAKVSCLGRVWRECVALAPLRIGQLGAR